MKKAIALVALCCLTFAITAQNEFKKLALVSKSKMAKDQAVYIEPIDNDRLLLVDHFRNSMEANGFKITKDRKEATYAITVRVDHRSDTGCGGRVMKKMDGEIIDLKNSAEKVATFTFSQGALEGKCTSDIMSSLAKKLSAEAK